jgi:hypothetical protein
LPIESSHTSTTSYQGYYRIKPTTNFMVLNYNNKSDSEYALYIENSYKNRRANLYQGTNGSYVYIRNSGIALVVAPPFTTNQTIEFKKG